MLGKCCKREKGDSGSNMEKQKMTISNIITLSRLVLLPFIVYFLLTEQRVIAFVFMLISLLSDGLDGYLARRLNQVSLLGRYLDPLCDKIFLAVILVTLLYLGAVPLWAVVVIVMRDFLILLGSYILLKRKAVVEVSNSLGKIAGFTFGGMILAFTIDLRLLGTVFLYLSITTMTFAFITYAMNYLRIMKGVE
jgi:CDP-diacylglycerol--glycerol-3-phosphate 3-phosphatidyltransferase